MRSDRCCFWTGFHDLSSYYCEQSLAAHFLINLSVVVVVVIHDYADFHQVDQRLWRILHYGEAKLRACGPFL